MTVIRIVKIVSWIVSFFAIIYTINMYYISAKGTAPIDLKKTINSYKNYIIIHYRY